MIVLDTSGLLAALDADQRYHHAARRVLESASGPFLLSPFVLAEVDYLLMTRVGVQAEVALLRQVADGAYHLVSFEAEDVSEAGDLIERYRDLQIGLADASVAVIAAKAKTTAVLTLDERHFRVIKPSWGKSFTVLPADA